MNSISQNNGRTQLARPIWPGLLVALIITVSLAGIMDHDLWTPDEPREAAIALGMSRTGNLIIPELAGQPFVEKPPLFYITASFFLLGLGKIVGHTAALRLVSACFGLLTLLFTYQLGKIYFDRQKALIAAGILATMLGFVHVTHWLLVDNALMFFITTAVWALAKAYENNRLSFLPLAGIFAAGAFLTKGMIGPIIIGLAWLGIFIPWVNKYGGVGQPCPTEPNGGTGCPALPRLKFPIFKRILRDAGLGYHALGLIVFGLISAIWIIAFALKGGPELFREWWWTNHFGRFTGAAHALGHISPWYYYLGILPVYILPWLVPFVIALVVLFKKLFKAEPVPAGGALLALWTLGAFLLLSFSATKRDIYLSALMPACALLCIYGLDLPSPTVVPTLREAGTKAGGRAAKVGEKFYGLWMFLLFVILAAFITAPLVKSGFFGFAFIAFTFGWQQVMALATLVISLLALARRTAPFLQRFLIVATLCYSALLIIICPVVDGYKSYGPAFRSAANAIRAHPALKVAGWKLDETTVAGFYYYCGLVFPAVADQKMLDDIRQGQDLRFNGVLTLKKNVFPSPNDLPDEENQVIFESRMGKRRWLQLIAAPDWEKKCGMKPARVYPPPAAP